MESSKIKFYRKEQAFLDEVAESCKQDPTEFRIELLNRVLDMPIDQI